MSAGTFTDGDGIYDVEEATGDNHAVVDKKLNIHMPGNQHNGSNVGSRRSSLSNVEQVHRNLEYLEEMYDTLFRKVNRLFVDTEI